MLESKTMRTPDPLVATRTLSTLVPTTFSRTSSEPSMLLISIYMESGSPFRPVTVSCLKSSMGAVARKMISVRSARAFTTMSLIEVTLCCTSSAGASSGSTAGAGAGVGGVTGFSTGASATSGAAGAAAGSSTFGVSIMERSFSILST